MLDNPNSEPTWAEVAEAPTLEQAVIIAGALRAAGIPAFVDTSRTLGKYMGLMGGSIYVLVAAADYEDALDLLDDTPPPMLDTPGIQL